MPTMLKGDSHKYLATVTLLFYSDIAQNRSIPLPEGHPVRPGHGLVEEWSVKKAWISVGVGEGEGRDVPWQQWQSSFLPLHGPGEPHGVGCGRCPQEVRHASPKGRF